MVSGVLFWGGSGWVAIPLRVPAALGVSLLPTDRSTASQSICPRQLQSGTFHSRLTGSGRLCLLAFLPRAAIARAMGEVVDSAAIAVGEVVDSAAQARARATVVTTPAGVTTETRQGQCTSDVVAEVAPLISGTRWLVRCLAADAGGVPAALLMTWWLTQLLPWFCRERSLHGSGCVKNGAPRSAAA